MDLKKLNYFAFKRVKKKKISFKKSKNFIII